MIALFFVVVLLLVLYFYVDHSSYLCLEAVSLRFKFENMSVTEALICRRDDRCDSRAVLSRWLACGPVCAKVGGLYHGV